MILPIGDAPNPKGHAPVTWALIALNVAVYLFASLPAQMRPADPNDERLVPYLEVVAQNAPPGTSLTTLARQTTEYDLVVFSYGYRPVEPSLLALFASLFLHGGLLHLAGNMLFLWIYGDNVERRLGPLPYIAAYLATGVAATLSHALFVPDSPLPLVGASGAISGVLGFYFLWFPRNRVRLLFFLPPFFLHVFEVPARIVLGLYVILDNLLPFLLTSGEGSGVAHGAHLGGFVAGLATALLLERRRHGRRPTVQIDAELVEESIPALVDGGRFAEAARLYFDLTELAARRLLTSEQAAALGRWLRDEGHADAALVVLRRQIRDALSGPGLGEVYALAGLILLDEGEPTTAWQYLLTALDLRTSTETERSVREALARIDALQKRQLGRLHRPRSW